MFGHVMRMAEERIPRKYYIQKWRKIQYLRDTKSIGDEVPTPSSFISFLLPSWRAVRSYRSHLVERDAIWGDGWSHSYFIRRSPSWGFLGFSSAIRQMPGDLFTAPRILIISDRRDWSDTRGKWLGTRTGADESFFWPQLMAPWTTDSDG